LNFSRITEDVLVGTTPRPADFARLQRMGVRLVINMRSFRGSRPEALDPKLQYLRLRTFDNPLLLIPTSALIRGVLAALRVIQDGGSVYTHCSRGRHRSVAMAAAILIAQGRTPEEAMTLIKQQRPRADPGAAHIRSRILKFEQAWRLAHGPQP
jgi:protein tyrosine phosphatase (PTP) superfamily phosphohydrolase (DUF442 family)